MRGRMRMNLYVLLARGVRGVFCDWGCRVWRDAVVEERVSEIPAVYRTQEGIKSVMPAGMAFMFVAMVVLTVIYAMLYRGGSGIVEGARFVR